MPFKILIIPFLVVVLGLSACVTTYERPATENKQALAEIAGVFDNICIRSLPNLSGLEEKIDGYRKTATLASAGSIGHFPLKSHVLSGPYLPGMTLMAHRNPEGEFFTCAVMMSDIDFESFEKVMLDTATHSGLQLSAPFKDGGSISREIVGSSPQAYLNVQKDRDDSTVFIVLKK